MAEKVFEGRWECPSCSSECLGRHERCPNCGAPRPQNVEFYLPSGVDAISDPDLLADAASGPDWYCNHCGGANSDLVDGVRRTRCVQCADPRDNEDSAHPLRHYAPGRAPSNRREARALLKSRFSPHIDTDPRPELHFEDLKETKAHLERRHFFMIAGTAFILAFLIFSAFFPWSKSTLTITGFNWTRTVPIEAIKTVHESGWSLPAKAFNDTPMRKIQSYVSVVDHYDTRTRQVPYQAISGTQTYSCMVSQGNGFFRTQTCTRPAYSTRYRTESYQAPVYRQEPVWGIWHSYDIDHWVKIRAARSSGEDQTPKWPAINLAKGERAGSRTQIYQVALQDQETGAKDIRKLSQPVWSKLHRGDVIHASYNIFGKELRNDLPNVSSVAP